MEYLVVHLFVPTPLLPPTMKLGQQTNCQSSCTSCRRWHKPAGSVALYQIRKKDGYDLAKIPCQNVNTKQQIKWRAVSGCVLLAIIRCKTIYRALPQTITTQQVYMVRVLVEKQYTRGSYSMSMNGGPFFITGTNSCFWHRFAHNFSTVHMHVVVCNESKHVAVTLHLMPTFLATFLGPEMHPRLCRVGSHKLLHVLRIAFVAHNTLEQTFNGRKQVQSFQWWDLRW